MGKLLNIFFEFEHPITTHATLKENNKNETSSTLKTHNEAGSFIKKTH